MDVGLTNLEIGGFVFAGLIVVVLGVSLAVWAWYDRKRRIAWRDIKAQFDLRRQAPERADAAAPVAEATLEPSGGSNRAPRPATAPQVPTPVRRNPVDNWSAFNGVVATDGPTATTGTGSVPPRGTYRSTRSGVAGRCATSTADGGEPPATWTPGTRPRTTG